MSQIIPINRSIIPACDVSSIEDYRRIVNGTKDNQKVGGYKIGFELALRYGLPLLVAETRNLTNKPTIYDHQKAGTDIPDTGKKFAETVKEAGVNAVILFPQSGPIVAYEWIMAAQEAELGVIVGGEMTHQRYLEGDFSNPKGKDYDGIFEELGIISNIPGFIRRIAPHDIYGMATKMGVTNFVVPGNNPKKIKNYKSFIEACGAVDPVFYAPGFVAQGGEISEGARSAGKRFHAIVGRAIYNADDIRQAALDLTSKL